MGLKVKDDDKNKHKDVLSKQKFLTLRINRA